MKRSPMRNAFLQHLQFEKRLSLHTVNAYRTDLDQFFCYLDKAYKIEEIEAINHQLIRSWIVELLNNKISNRSIHRKISVLNSFYKYLLQHNQSLVNPMSKVVTPKLTRRLTTFVNTSSIDQLLESDFFGSDFEGVRDRLIIEVFYATGMRLSELLDLKTHNVNLFETQLKVSGKRNKERIIPFTLQLKRKIETYLQLKTQIGIPSSDFFFTTENGNKMYARNVYRIVNKYLTMTTTVDKRSPHVLRHTFATHMLNNGADINSIKELLGHANLSATQVYTHNTVEKLKNVHKQAHPRG